MAKRLMDFLTGAAVGAALVAYLKSDKDRIVSLLDKAEAALMVGDETSRPDEDQKMEEEKQQ